MRNWAACIALVGLAACDLPPPDPARVADQCEQRAREAQAPTASLTLGANNRSGGFVEGSVGLTSDFLRGRDPLQVYEECVFARTGELPIRPPRLRDI